MSSGGDLSASITVPPSSMRPVGAYAAAANFSTPSILRPPGGIKLNAGLGGAPVSTSFTTPTSAISIMFQQNQSENAGTGTESDVLDNLGQMQSYVDSLAQLQTLASTGGLDSVLVETIANAAMQAVEANNAAQQQASNNQQVPHREATTVQPPSAIEGEAIIHQEINAIAQEAIAPNQETTTIVQAAGGIAQEADTIAQEAADVAQEPSIVVQETATVITQDNIPEQCVDTSNVSTC